MKEYRLEVTYLAVTCWVFAGFGDLAVLVAMSMQHENLAWIAITASGTLAFLGFRNVRQYSMGTHQPGGWYQPGEVTSWIPWFPFGVVHLLIVELMIGIEGLISEGSEITKKFPELSRITQMKTEVGMVIIGAVFALYVTILLWRLGFLDRPIDQRCWSCSTPVFPHASYCHECGVKLYRCGHCGRLYSPTANFCPKCGTYVGPP